MSYFTHPSKCKYCQKEIVWIDSKPHDAQLRNEVYIPRGLHFLTCSAKIKEKAQRICPVCRLNASEVHHISQIDMTKPICKDHRAIKYEDLRKLKLRENKKLKLIEKNKDTVQLEWYIYEPK